MVVGYSLGNKNSEQDIQVLGESDDNVITYSKTLEIPLTQNCRNNCGYCAFKGSNNLIVPYSTISKAKQARTRGTREVLFVSGERPDLDPEVRSLLNLWGFDTYTDYIYTVAELSFLEGLIPVIETGLLSPDELEHLKEISACYKIMIDSVDDKFVDKVYPNSPGKRLESRLKVIEWTGKLQFPIITGIIVDIGETKTHRKMVLKHLAALHAQYGHIHEVLIQNFVPQPGTEWEKRKATSHKIMLETVEMAFNILPSDINITIPVHLNTKIEDFIKAGIRDFPRIIEGRSTMFLEQEAFDFDEFEKIVNKAGFRLQHRFPIKYSFIKEGFYSKKLGQVFDAYKYKIKKSDQKKEEG